VQAANVLASPQAVEMGIFVVRAFVRMRELASVHADLATQVRHRLTRFSRPKAQEVHS
jgi:hypothetical protein